MSEPSPDIKTDEIGFCIMETRMARKMKLDDLAKKTSLSVRYIDMVEKGMLLPSVGKLKRIAYILGLDIDPFIQALGAGVPVKKTTKKEVGKKREIEEENAHSFSGKIPDLSKKKESPVQRVSMEGVAVKRKLVQTEDRNIERRQFTRFHADFYSECDIEGEKIFITFVDISQGGLRILLTKYFPPDIRLQLKINTFDNILSMLTRIVWIQKLDLPGNQFQAGLEILSISEDDRIKYHELIQGKLKAIDE
ncbi:MAG: PilZ domain-containing protein [Candidatus Aureabacteria bacterium]|nr:PilZ domain-containing protein [Candidatus Auribacterota bacterium]